MKIFLEEKLKKRMTEARMYIKDFVKSDLISVNSAQLKTDVQLATKAGFGADFEMMGDSGYASLFSILMHQHYRNIPKKIGI